MTFMYRLLLPNPPNTPRTRFPQRELRIVVVDEVVTRGRRQLRLQAQLRGEFRIGTLARRRGTIKVEAGPTQTHRACR